MSVQTIRLNMSTTAQAGAVSRIRLVSQSVTGPVDGTTSAALAAHLADTDDAHDASAVSVADAGGYYAGTNVETVLAESGQAAQELWPWLGYDVLPRDLATGTALVTLGKGQFYFRIFVPDQDMVASGIAMASTATASSGLTLCRFALAHIGANITLSTYVEANFTLLARTANDTAMFNTINTLYSRLFDTSNGWPSTVRLIKGQRYAVGYWLAGTTAPTVVSTAAFMRTQTNGTDVSPFVGGRPAGLEAHTEVPPYWRGDSYGYDGLGVAPWYNLTTVPSSTKARPLRTALLGDSYVASYAGWFSWGNAQSGALLLPTIWAGVGGETTTQVLARIAAVTATAPQVTVVSCGINDIAATVSSATVIANLTAIYQALVAAGSKVIICTVPPNTSMDAGELVTLAAVNAWLLALNVSNVWVANTGNALTTGDGVTRNAALYTDGAHPNFAGCQAMANVLDGVIQAAVA